MAPSRCGAMRGSTTAAIGVLALLALSSACGSDDDAGSTAGESGDVVDVTTAAGTGSADTAVDPPPSDDDGAGSDDVVVSPDLELGLGSATVTFGEEVHRFALTPERALDGQCRTLFGVLVVDLPLVESNGVEVPPGNGWLRLDIEVEDVADFEPYVDARIAGGHWVAGASETASLTGVETPEITLVGSGATISGTQAMVPLVTGPGEPIEATVEATCE